MVPRHSSPRWPPGTAFPTWWFRPVPEITSRSTSAWTATTSSVPSTRSQTASSTVWTWPRSMVESSSTMRRWVSTQRSCSRPSTATRSARQQRPCCRICSGPDAPGLDLRFTGPDGSPRETADVILVSNNPYELQRFSGRGTRERLDLGVLGVAGATIDDASAAARFITLELAGQVRRFPGWVEWTTPRFQIDANEAVDIGIDGEAMTMDPPLVFDALPGALVVRLPRHATGRSPAARAVHLASRGTIVDLARIVGGIESAKS